jgi:peptide deformylase
MDHLDGKVYLDRLRGIRRSLLVRRIHKRIKAGTW